MYNQKIMEAILDAVLYSPVRDELWQAISDQESSKVLSQVLKEVREVCPGQLYTRLDNAILGDGCTTADFALFCGMQIGSGLHQITASPQAMTDFVGRYMAGARAHS